MSNSDYIPDSLVLSYILAVLLTIWGIVWIGIGINVMLYIREHAELFIYANPEFKESDLDFFNLIMRYHNNLLEGLLAFTGGVLMMFRKNFGWSIALAVGIIEIIRFSWLLIVMEPDPNIAKFTNIFSVGLILFFLVFSLFLFLPKIRERFTVIRKNGLFALIVVLVMELDFFLL